MCSLHIINILSPTGAYNGNVKKPKGIQPYGIYPTVRIPLLSFSGSCRTLLGLEQVSHLHLPGIRLEIVLCAGQGIGHQLAKLAQRDVIPDPGLQVS